MGSNLVSTPLPPAAELAPRLRAVAAREEDGSLPDDGNELLRFLNASPDHAATMMEHHFELWLQSSLGPRLTELVRLAVANQTGCPICLSIRRPGAVRAGVDEELIAAIEDPDDGRLDARERSAVAFATGLAGDHREVTETTYRELRRHFDDREVAELAMMIISFTGMGRLLETLTRGSACPVRP